MSETNNIVWYDSVLPITLGIKPLPARTPKAKADAYYNACKQEISKIISAYKSYYYSVGIRDGHNGGFFLNISQHRVWQSEAVGREETTRLTLICKLENGTRDLLKVNVDYAMRIAKAMGMTVEQLFSAPHHISKDEFESMIKDWLFDNSPEYDDLVIDFDGIRISEDDPALGWTADAHDKKCSYNLHADREGNIYIVYAGTR